MSGGLRAAPASKARKPEAIRRKDDTYYVTHDTNQIPGIEQLYSTFLGEKTRGFFVEFGAFDGETTSNTSGLADLGWAGVYIEPVEEFFQQCVARHQKNSSVFVFNCGVSDTAGEGEISVGGPLSTLSSNALASFQNLPWARGFHRGDLRKINLRPLADILAEVDAPVGFDVLSVDVEGYEWEALQAFDFDTWRPKMVIVELHDNNPNYPLEWPDSFRLLEKMDAHGYRIVWKNLSNTVFVSSETRPSVPNPRD